MADRNDHFVPDDDRLREILRDGKRVAVVGISDKPDRASHGIARFLIGQGYEVYGVNPTLKEVLGRPVVPGLADLPVTVDIVNVFRRSEAVPAVVDETITHGARVLWLQEGVIHAEAAGKAGDAGLDVVMDRCIYKEWLRLGNP